MTRARAVLVALAIALGAAACKHHASSAEAPIEPERTIVLRESSDGLLLTWIDEKGDFHTEMKPDDVPLVGRDIVKVIDTTKDEGTHADKVFVADMRLPNADGTYPIHTMTRAEFDQIAVDRRAQRGPTLASAAPPASDAPPFPQPQPGRGAQGDTRPEPPGPTAGRPLVIIYGADWCSACHEAAAYLRRKGVSFVEKNVEQDAAAAREMHQKLSKSGLRGGSIPVLDVKGKIMVGFNARSVDDALGQAI
jgi:glutaredoxin